MKRIITLCVTVIGILSCTQNGQQGVASKSKKVLIYMLRDNTNKTDLSLLDKVNTSFFSQYQKDYKNLYEIDLRIGYMSDVSNSVIEKADLPPLPKDGSVTSNNGFTQRTASIKLKRAYDDYLAKFNQAVANILKKYLGPSEGKENSSVYASLGYTIDGLRKVSADYDQIIVIVLSDFIEHSSYLDMYSGKYDLRELIEKLKNTCLQGHDVSPLPANIKIICINTVEKQSEAAITDMSLQAIEKIYGNVEITSNLQ